MKTNLIARCFTLFAWMFCSIVVLHAHPGHELRDSSVQHVISSPYHLLCLGLLGGGCLIAARFMASRRARKVLATTGCALIAAGFLFQVL